MEDCDIQLDSTTMNAVSRRHFSIKFDWDGNGGPSRDILMIRNLSRNGTLVNGELLKFGGALERVLDPFSKTVVEAGPVKMIFELHQPTDEALFDRHWRSFLRNAAAALPRLEGLRTNTRLGPTPIVDLRSAKRVRRGEMEPAETTYPGSAARRGSSSVAVWRAHNASTELEASDGAKTEYAFIKQLAMNHEKASDFRKFITVVAEKTSGERRVIKRVLASRVQRTRFHARELDFATRVRHSHIVEFLGIKDLMDSFEIHMEYLPGDTLYRYVEGNLPLSSKQGACLLDHMLEALTYLQSIPLLHRDIKPLNIMVAGELPLRFKLIDFDLACEPGDIGLLASQASEVGTPHFVAPEICAIMSGAIPRKDAASFLTQALDVWSLGATLWYASTGMLISPHTGVRNADAPSEDSEAETILQTGRSAIRTSTSVAPPQSRTWGDFAIDVDAQHELVDPQYRFSELGLSLVRQMVDLVPQARPTPKECHQHAWVVNGLQAYKEEFFLDPS